MYVHVRIKTGQKAESVRQIAETKYEVSVRPRAERNMANTRLLELMKGHLGARSVRIVSGHHGPSKLLSVDY